MRTRNLTIVVKDGEFKIAQYGQWDGYPECGGLEALAFARKLTDKSFRKRFEDNLDQCRFITEEEAAKIDERIKNKEIKDWVKEYPQLSRDTGRRILDMVHDCDGGMLLANSIDFAADSLFCEWAWLIDLDTDTLEAYEGFNHSPLSENDRFWFLKERSVEDDLDQYHPVVKVAEWSLTKLPEDQDFLNSFSKEEE